MGHNNAKIVLGGILLMCISIIVSCDSAEEISRGLDMTVPTCVVIGDSAIVNPGATLDVRVNVTDNVALAKIEFSYGKWFVVESKDLSDVHPQEYQFRTAIVVPVNAEKEWQETVYRNDGSSYKINQSFHKLELIAYDINQNVRKIYIYVKIKE